MGAWNLRRQSRSCVSLASVVALTVAGIFARGSSLAQIPTPTPSFAVQQLNPSSGTAASYTAVTIMGTGFSPSASVTLGGVPAAETVYLDPTRIVILTPILLPGTLNDVVILNPVTFALSPMAVASLHQGWLADFLDVSQSDPFHYGVEAVFRGGITAGCGSGNYCRDDAVRRDQMAVFLLKAEHGAAYAPPACTGLFTDVPCPGPFTDWVEQLSNEGITGGCGDGIYCPSAAVNRSQMAVFLLKTKHGVNYVPPACTGLFSDVPCPGNFTDWIEELYAEGVTGGCYPSPLSYCPNLSSTRGQMAVFLAKAFGLVIVPPTPTPTPTWNALTPTPTPAPPTPTPTPNSYPGYWAVQPGIYVPCSGIKPFLPFVNPADGQIYYLGGDVNANMPHPNLYGTYIDAIYYNHTRAYYDAQGFITPMYRQNGPPNWYPAPSSAAELCPQWASFGNTAACPGGTTSWYTTKFMSNEVWLLSYAFYAPSIQAACGN